MTTGKLNENRYIIRLEPDDDILASIKSFCEDNQVVNAAVWGIGSVVDPVLGHYEMSRKSYKEKRLTGTYELATLMGNVGLANNELFVHAHVVISDEDMSAFGGHLIGGKCGATCELIVHQFDSKFERRLDDDIGLKVWQLPD